jgi:chromate reductase
MPVMQQPEAYLGGAGGFFGDGDEIKVEGTRKFLETIIQSFARWVDLVLAERSD